MQLNRRQFLIASGIATVGGGALYASRPTAALQAEFSVADESITTSDGTVQRVVAVPSIDVEWANAEPYLVQIRTFVSDPSREAFVKVQTYARAPAQWDDSVPDITLYDSDPDSSIPSTDVFTAPSDGATNQTDVDVRFVVELLTETDDVIVATEAQDTFTLSVTNAADGSGSEGGGTTTPTPTPAPGATVTVTGAVDIQAVGPAAASAFGLGEYGGGDYGE